jgi:hypothetical protein
LVNNSSINETNKIVNKTKEISSSSPTQPPPTSTPATPLTPQKIQAKFEAEKLELIDSLTQTFDKEKQELMDKQKQIFTKQQELFQIAQTTKDEMQSLFDQLQKTFSRQMDELKQKQQDTLTKQLDQLSKAFTDQLALPIFDDSKVKKTEIKGPLNNGLVQLEMIFEKEKTDLMNKQKSIFDQQANLLTSNQLSDSEKDRLFNDMKRTFELEMQDLHLNHEERRRKFMKGDFRELEKFTSFLNKEDLKKKEELMMDESELSQSEQPELQLSDSVSTVISTIDKIEKKPTTLVELEALFDKQVELLRENQRIEFDREQPKFRSKEISDVEKKTIFNNLNKIFEEQMNQIRLIQDERRQEFFKLHPDLLNGNNNLNNEVTTTTVSTFINPPQSEEEKNFVAPQKSQTIEELNELFNKEVIELKQVQKSIFDKQRSVFDSPKISVDEKNNLLTNLRLSFANQMDQLIKNQNERREKFNKEVLSLNINDKQQQQPQPKSSIKTQHQMQQELIQKQIEQQKLLEQKVIEQQREQQKQNEIEQQKIIELQKQQQHLNELQQQHNLEENQNNLDKHNQLIQVEIEKQKEAQRQQQIEEQKVIDLQNQHQMLLFEKKKMKEKNQQIENNNKNDLFFEQQNLSKPQTFQNNQNFIFEQQQQQQDLIKQQLLIQQQLKLKEQHEKVSLIQRQNHFKLLNLNF